MGFKLGSFSSEKIWIRTIVDSKASPISNAVMNDQDFFDQKPRLLVVTLVVLFLLAALIRLYGIKAPGMLVEREYSSAILARNYYFDFAESVEGWRMEINEITQHKLPVLEPPITEFLVSLIYWITGVENIWFSRILTTLFWLLGGIFIYNIAKILLSTDAAVYSTAYYLFVPLGILVSRSFQADSLMMLFYLMSLFSILMYFEKQSITSLLVASCISGLTLLYRPLVIFSICSAFISLVFIKTGSLKFFFNKQALIFFFVSLLPPFVYYGMGIFISGFLRFQADMSFRPYLLVQTIFWKDWIYLAVSSVGSSALIAACVGAPMLRKGVPRALVMGLAAGYFIFGLVFTFHIHTHGYYHLQLIPIVAFSSAPVVVLIVKSLRSFNNKWYWWFPVVGSIFVIVFFNIREIRSELNSQIFENPITARHIGEVVKHSDKSVFIAYHYGLPLQYYGELTGSFWPRKIEYWLYRQPDEKELSVSERLGALEFTPEYFIITNFNEYYKHHADLNDFLVDNCAPLAESDEYLIYGNCDI